MTDQQNPTELQLEGFEETEDSLAGVLARIVHHNLADGWTVARFDAQGYVRPVTIVGHLAEPTPDQSLLLFGQWITHPQYGQQFRFDRYQLNIPTTPKALERYLGSGVLKGVGPATAKKMLLAFGIEITKILDAEPERLLDVPGISPTKLEKIRQSWIEQKGVQNVMLFLQGHGISAAYAHRIYREYGDDAIHIVKDNPYRLAAEVSGIGFRTADRIAQKLGFSRTSPFRIEAGIKFALEEAASNSGHVFLPRSALLQASVLALEDKEFDTPSENETTTNLTLESDLIDALDRMLHDGLLIGEVFYGEKEVSIYLPDMHRAERGVAAHILRLMEAPPSIAVSTAKLEQWRTSSRRIRDITLSEAQATGVVSALTHKVMVLTGGPGVGKTTTTKAIVDLFEEAGCKIELACPTGRAAKRLSELTGRQARTIHRMLEMDPANWRFRRNHENPLNADVVIVDEASMLDLPLTHSLLAAIPDRARLVLVGDADQLPSVGAGTVLRDLLASNRIERAELKEIFRQQQESLIVTNAHRVNHGAMPAMVKPEQDPDANCLFVSLQEPQAIAERIVRLVGHDLPRKGFDPWDIQVITPMHKGDLGTQRFNRLLQTELNPPSVGRHDLRRGEKVIREGDRVMQTQNDYSKQVFNGDIGTVISVNPGSQEITVQYVDQTAQYEADEIDEIELAYAMTVHKSQGSEYPAVIIVLHPSHFVMLQRNLLYTALTRAQRMAVLVGSPRAVWRAVNTNRQVRRHSNLRLRLDKRVRYE